VVNVANDVTNALASGVRRLPGPRRAQCSSAAPALPAPPAAAEASGGEEGGAPRLGASMFARPRYEWDLNHRE
jgi:hypothetical protein